MHECSIGITIHKIIDIIIRIINIYIYIHICKSANLDIHADGHMNTHYRYP